MIGLKAHWQVVAGLTPGHVMSTYTRSWSYLSTDYEKDGGTQKSSMFRPDSDFSLKKKEAHEYAQQLEAGGLNWVHVEYLWL